MRNYLILRFSVPDKQVITLCATLFIGQITNMLSNNIDILLLRGILKDPQQVGYYFAGVRIPKIIETMFIAQLPAPFLYYFSSPNTKLLKEKILVNSSKMLGFIFGIVGLLCFSFASEILLFLFGDRYIESINA
ncbi:MAG: oligosaccharide flippase family protein, partial [Endomicrobia bacterium]|nr:oligosaccharide flippase family protein [Endomicrobiia bacterium]